jgi:hypothetical protein
VDGKIPSYVAVIEEEAAFAKKAVEAGVGKVAEEADLLSAYAILGNIPAWTVALNKLDLEIADRRATLRDIAADHPVSKEKAALCLPYYGAVIAGIDLAEKEEPLTDAQAAIRDRACRERAELRGSV